MKSFMANPSNIEHNGTLLTQLIKLWAAWLQRLQKVLRGKHKPTFTPHMDTGDHVIIINADKVVLTGKKLTHKIYFRHSGYLGGDSYVKAGDMLKKNPVKMVELAVKGMIPHNSLGAQIFSKLHVYAGSEHPHAAQKPEVMEINVR